MQGKNKGKGKGFSMGAHRGTAEEVVVKDRPKTRMEAGGEGEDDEDGACTQDGDHGGDVLAQGGRDNGGFSTKE